VFLSDFGFSLFQKDSETRIGSFFGTPGSIAPEILSLESFNSKADVFSLGVLMFSLMTGHYLFGGNSLQQTLELNELCNLDFLSAYIEEFSAGT